jgi:hypothetical protein
MDVDRLINALTELLAYFQVFRSKPAPYTLILQIGIKAICKFLIGIGVANEGRIVFYDRSQRFDML